MMKIRLLVLALLVLAVSVALAMPTLGSQEEENFIIVGADAVATRAAGTAFTSPIRVEPRFILERADAMDQVEINAPPGLPWPLLPRFILQWADTMVIREVHEPEGMPRDLEPRFILQWADTSREIHLVYPCELVGDETAPVISLLDLLVQDGSATISWQTDELADSLVEYGLAPGSYTDSVYDPDYTRAHQLVVSGLLPDTSYYCRVTSTDRCGNAASSNFEWHPMPPPSYIYLPLVLRNH
jgi:hypothetical protein